MHNIIIDRKTFLSKTQLTENELISNLNSCGLPSDIKFFNENSLSLISSYIKKTNPTICIDFNESDFYSNEVIIEESLESKMNKRKKKRIECKIIKKELKKHQEEAKDSIIIELSKNDRCQFISACGTGKTFTAQKIVEEMIKNAKESITLVLVPSLELLSQFSTSWRANSEFDAHNKNEFLLCSKKELKKVNQKNFTDIKFIKKLHSETNETTIYLKRELAHKIIFSTYQSVHLLAESLLITNKKIDIAIYDEAHKTVGKYTSNFAFSLYDSNIKINKRIFMTATPKISVDEYTKDCISMDNETLFGKIAYKLTVGEAIKKGIIKDYKIIVSKVDKKVIDQNEYSSLVSESILKIANEKNINKILLFNNTINDSKKISNYLNKKELIFKNGFSSIHIDGYMEIDKRRGAIRSLNKNDEKTIVSNAKLFSEGVDIPAIEMIGFLNRTKSVVDIAQRIGRVQRKKDENDTEPGYIFIPLFSEESNINEYCSGDFDYLIDVLLSFREIDDRINKSLYSLYSGNYEDFYKNIEIIEPEKMKRENPTNIKLLNESIAEKIKVAVISKTSENWNINYHLYKEFLIENKRMPKENLHNQDETFLSKWHQNQVKRKKNNLLNSEKIKLLNSLGNLGFSWNKMEAQWFENFNKFKAFYIKNKCEPKSYGKEKNITKDEREEGLLAKWLCHQKTHYRNNKLEDSKIKLLSEYLTDWEIKSERLWNSQYQKFKVFIEENGYFPMDNNEERKIYTWILKQKNKNEANELEKRKAELLDNVTKDWRLTGKERIWKQQLAKCERFMIENKRFPEYSNNTKRSDKYEHNIYLWFRTQKRSVEKGSLKEWQNKLFSKIYKITLTK